MKPKPPPFDYHIRGFLTKAYPEWNQIVAMQALQPSLRAAWNYLVWLRTSHRDALEDYCVQRDLVDPKPARPEYKGMTSEESSAAKSVYYEACKARRKQIRDVTKDCPDAPQPIYLTAKPGVKSVLSHCIEKGYVVPSAKGKAHDYQALNFVLRERGLPELPALLAQSLIKCYTAKSDYPKRHKKSYEPMPIQVRSGRSLEVIAERGLKNAKVFLSGVPGAILCHLHPSVIARLKQPGNYALEGITLRHEAGTWWCSVKLQIRKSCKAVYNETGEMVDSGAGPSNDSVLGIDPGLAKLYSDSEGNSMKNPRNKQFKDACAVAQSVLQIARTEGVPQPDLELSLARTVARSARRVKEQLRQYAAWVDKNFRYVGVEENHGIAIGIGSKTYTGATKALVSALKQKMGTDRVREVEAFYNSQDCSQCSQRDKITWQRRLGEKDQTCTCSSCGYTADRDFNAARNVRAKFMISLAA